MPIVCAALAILTSVDAHAETARCPHTDSASCEEWRLARVEEELAAMLSRRSVWIEAMPADKRDRARAALLEAQKQWVNFREAECARKLTWAFATAMTERGYLAQCRLNMTQHRRNELEREYRFAPR